MMKTNLKMTNVRANEAAVRAAAMRDRLYAASEYTAEELLGLYNVPAGGLTDALAERSRDEYGANILTNGKKDSAAKRLAEAFISPFTLVLLALAVISVFTDIVFASAGERSYATVGIISAMVIISGTLRYVQETRSCNVAEKLTGMLHTTACAERGGVKREIPIEEIAVGDLIHLSAGDMIPADLRILTAKDLFISQSALTGESEPVEKTACSGGARDTLTDTENLAFMGSNVVSGSATAVAVAVGNGTMLGNMAGSLNGEAPKTAFEKGVNSVSWVLIRFMLIMVPVVLFINGFTKGDWVQALLFAISVAVGLTPEMLPMIVTACLAKGAVVMSREKVIIKNLNSIQNLGSMDILCTDKTGTLTQDRVVLEYHLNVDGAEDERVLRHAFLNSYFQTGLKNLIDIAVIARQQELGTGDLTERYTKVDEIPFDFERRRMSVVVRDRAGKTQLVTKGAVEEMLKCCSFAECGGSVLPLTDEVRSLVTSRSDAMNEQGMRVIAVAQKTNPAPAGEFSAADERDMVLIGFLAFLDPPKDTTKAAVQALTEYGVSVKILTGDNEKVTRAICSQVGLDAENMLLGSEIDALTDAQLGRLAAGVTVFAKHSRDQMACFGRVRRARAHRVGFLGEAITAAAALWGADVGISVDTAVDIAKETAGVVLLEKDLMVLERGVVEGRKIYANMIKYIKITASSNFGNMLSVLASSAFLPFLPMASIHLILLNLIYDVSCTAMSWDNVDAEYLRSPRKWDAAGISRFMLRIGPTSSVFDIATFLLMYFVICPAFTGGELYTSLTDPASRALYVSIFQTGWFIESMWSQALVIHMLRTPKLPFVQSRAAAPVTLLTLAGSCAVTVIPFTPLGRALGFTALPAAYFLWLAAIVAGYMLLATAVKKSYVRRYGELL